MLLAFLLSGSLPVGPSKLVTYLIFKSSKELTILTLKSSKLFTSSQHPTRWAAYFFTLWERPKGRQVLRWAALATTVAP